MLVTETHMRSSVRHCRNKPISRTHVQTASVNVQTKSQLHPYTFYLGNHGPRQTLSISWLPWAANSLQGVTRRKRLQEAFASCSRQVLATVNAAFYSYNTQITPSVLDFFNSTVQSLYDLSSDHLPILAIMHHTPQFQSCRQRFLPPGSSVETFRTDLDRRINLNMELSVPEDIEHAISVFMENIRQAAICASPKTLQQLNQRREMQLPTTISALLCLKRSVRREYARTSDIRVHRIYETLANRLQKVVNGYKQSQIDRLLDDAGKYASTNYSQTDKPL